MSDLFKDILKDTESLFKNEVALDPEFSPPKIPFRENENQYIATCIKPLFQKRTGKSLIIHGPPGVGKTLACKNVIKELEDTTDDIIPIYVNCWKKNSTYQIVLEICNAVEYKFTQNKRTDELISIITEKLNRTSSVLVFDEIDKIQELDILYNLIESLYRKTIILITNEQTWLQRLDSRVRSRLTPDQLEFKPYSLEETKEIIKQRIEYAFPQDVLNQDILNLISKKTFELKDVRIGLFLLRESGEIAESFSSKTIELSHTEEAIKKLKDFSNPTKLDEEETQILKIIKENPNKTTPEIFEIYKKNDGLKSIRTFHRKVKNLEKTNLISIEEINNIQGKSFKIKPLTEF